MTKFIPKVGDKVAFPGGFGEVTVANEDVNGFIIIRYSLGEYVRVATNAVEPIKTPAEIEREELSALISGTPFPDQVADAVINAGYRKQQVKSLSYEEFREICQNNSLISDWYEQLKPYTIQGGDK